MSERGWKRLSFSSQVLIALPSGEPTGAEYGTAGHIPQEVIQIIAAWVDSRQ